VADHPAELRGDILVPINNERVISSIDRPVPSEIASDNPEFDIIIVGGGSAGRAGHSSVATNPKVVMLAEHVSHRPEG
jgi:ribulose 1,5-bisphosphate synthetase/thiazole synthase